MQFAIDLLAPLVGVTVGALITYMINIRDRRTRHVEQIFRNAIAAVAAVQAATTFVITVPTDEIGLSEANAEELAQTIRAEGYHQFVRVVAHAREALANAVPYRDGLRAYVTEDNIQQISDKIIAELKKGPE